MAHIVPALGGTSSSIPGAVAGSQELELAWLLAKLVSPAPWGCFWGVVLAKSCFFQPQDIPKPRQPTCWAQACTPSTGGCLEGTCHCHLQAGTLQGPSHHRARSHFPRLPSSLPNSPLQHRARVEIKMSPARALHANRLCCGSTEGRQEPHCHRQGWFHGSGASWANPGCNQAVGREGRVQQVRGGWRQEMGEGAWGGRG